MFGYFETDDLEQADAYLAAQEVSARWQDALADLLEERVPDEGPPSLDEVFRLDGGPPPARELVGRRTLGSAVPHKLG
jgi:hypothetical protein